jgi:hypothetical protein
VLAAISRLFARQTAVSYAVRWLALFTLGACFSPAAPVGFPCGDGQTCPEGQSCDIVSNTCGVPSEALVLRDDTAEDFAMAGAYTAEVTIEPQGFVGPRAYVTGGIRVSGYDGLLLPDPAAASFDGIVANPRTGQSFVRRSLIRYSDSNPVGLGIADGDNATVIVEGEVDLEVTGSWRFQLVANDRGFFEIAKPGSDTFERIANDVDTGTVGTFEATETGWHRFRGAFQDAAQFLDYELQYDPPNVTGNGFREIPTDRLRAPASDISGLLVDGFEHANLMMHTGTLVSSAPLADVTLGVDPLGLAVGIGAFSLRFSGQFLIDTAGDYTFSITSFGGHRLWIDGARVVDAFSFDEETSATAPITLAPGWHDLVLDINKEGGEDGRLAFTISDFAGGVLPADHLRPVPGRASRFVADLNTADLALPDGTGASATRGLTVDFPASMIAPTDVTAGVNVAADNLATISLVVNPPAGPNIDVLQAGQLSGAGEEFFHVPVTVANAGSIWGFIGTDNLLDTLIGTITEVFVTVVYEGGIAPFETTSRYESAVRELGDAVAFERFAWTTRQAADPAAVVVKVRTCDTAEACAGEAYVDVENAGVPAVTPRRFFQYAVEITSDGDVPTALDTVELRYFVRGME